MKTPNFRLPALQAIALQVDVCHLTAAWSCAGNSRQRAARFQMFRDSLLRAWLLPWDSQRMNEQTVRGVEARVRDSPDNVTLPTLRSRRSHVRK